MNPLLHHPVYLTLGFLLDPDSFSHQAITDYEDCAIVLLLLRLASLEARKAVDELLTPAQVRQLRKRLKRMLRRNRRAEQTIEIKPYKVRVVQKGQSSTPEANANSLDSSKL